MPRARARDPMYRQRRFPAEVIENCVRWYISYRLSYRDLVSMMAERGIAVSHTTILRWVLRYVPEYEARWGRFAKPVHPSWRMDETAVRVRGGNHYLYRAVDKHGKSVDSLLCNARDRSAAQAFFEQAVSKPGSGWPGKVNVDGHSATHLALRQLRIKDRRWRSVEVRSNRYLNNIVEQDHRAIKRRCAGMLGLKTFRTASITLAGIELAHRIRKRQFWLTSERQSLVGSLKQMWDLALSKPGPIPILCQAFRQCTRTQSENSGLTEAQARNLKPRRYARKITVARGLYLLVAPRGGRYWRYDYQFEGRRKTLALGVHPAISLEKARARHQEARSLLARGVDPSFRKRELRTL